MVVEAVVGAAAGCARASVARQELVELPVNHLRTLPLVALIASFDPVTIERQLFLQGQIFLPFKSLRSLSLFDYHNS